MHSYPINLNMNGRTVLVVGLGAVGQRKAKALCEAGAHVVGIDPLVKSFDDDALSRMHVISERYQIEHLRGIDLVVAAASAVVNQQIVADARKKNIWVCSATDPDEGDFTIPAVWTSGPLVLTVSTSGASPALACILRDQAAAALGPAAVGLSEIFAELRPLVLRRFTNPLARKHIFEAWANPEWLSLWTEHGPQVVRQMLERLIDKELS